MWSFHIKLLYGMTFTVIPTEISEKTGSQNLHIKPTTYENTCFRTENAHRVPRLVLLVNFSERQVLKRLNWSKLTEID